MYVLRRMSRRLGTWRNAALLPSFVLRDGALRLYTGLMNRSVAFACSFLLLALFASPASPCTILVVARNGIVLAGANEDHSATEKYAGHWVRFFPAEESGALGYVSFGYDFSPLVDQAALNEAGLFYDYNALPGRAGANQGAEPADILKLPEMLKTCRTVDEALEFMALYDFAGMAKAQMVIGDATGASAIVERHTVTRRDPGTDYQIGTNFRTSTTPRNRITCWRYKLCNTGLSKSKPVSVESVRRLLENSMPKGRRSVSWYTSIYDLKAAEIHLFRKGDSSKAVVIDLKRELENGKREIDMDDLMESAARPYQRPNDGVELVVGATVMGLVLVVVVILWSRRSRFLKTRPVNETSAG
jgi:hypothetical protein